MGIIDPATTYTFFYALPAALLLLYFTPLIMELYHGVQVKGFKYYKVLWIPLALVCCLSGPLNPGIALVFSLLLLARGLIVNFKASGSGHLPKRFIYSIQEMPRTYYFFIIPVGVFSLYSLYLGRYNSIGQINHMDLAALYAKLPEGIYYQLTQKPGLSHWWCWCFSSSPMPTNQNLIKINVKEMQSIR